MPSNYNQQLGGEKRAAQLISDKMLALAVRKIHDRATEPRRVARGWLSRTPKDAWPNGRSPSP